MKGDWMRWLVCSKTDGELNAWQLENHYSAASKEKSGFIGPTDLRTKASPFYS
jgi:hypothetical protein